MERTRYVFRAKINNNHFLTFLQIQEVGGIEWLGRMADKACLAKEKSLPEDLLYPCPNDQKVLTRLGVDGTTFQSMASEAHDENDLVRVLKEKGYLNDDESSSPEEASRSSHEPHYTFSARFKTGSKQKVMHGKHGALADLALDMSLSSC